MTSELIKAKLKASAIHLVISAILFIAISYMVYYVWYPGPFFTAEGGLDGIKLMAAIDLVLGPSLTLIIFNHLKAKKEIMFDLSLIALVQIGALIWGGLQVYSERPVALVFWENTFYTVTEDYYKKQNIKLAEIEPYSKYQPLLIYAEHDHSAEQLEKIQGLNEQKIPPYAQVQLYKDVPSNMTKIIDKRVDYKLLKQEVKLETESQFDLDNINVILGKAKYKNLMVYLKDSGELIAIKARK